MNYPLISLEIAVGLTGLAVLLADLWLPAERRRSLGYTAAAVLGLILLASLRLDGSIPQFAFGQMYVLDGLALFFKRFFLLAAIGVLLMAAESAGRNEGGIAEYYSLTLFALLGMMFSASANDFSLLFVSVELITVTFYVLVSFERRRLPSLEAGVKYLILGALSSAFLVYGIALVYGLSGRLNFGEVAAVAGQFTHHKLFLFGLLLLLAGLAFKIAAFPFQIWAPDVYQGAPVPTTAFLAVGSKAAGFVLLLRVLFTAVPDVTARWTNLLVLVAAATILHGNLCAIPQRNLKRLLGYSSIAHAGYLLLGVAAMTSAGQAAVLYYLSGYLFTVLAAFAVLALVLRHVEGEDVTALAGLNQRSPLLAATMTLAMVSLAGVPPLAGFVGKFLLFKAALEQGAAHPGLYGLVAVAVFGVVISLYYYFGVVRVIFWSKPLPAVPPLVISTPLRAVLAVCLLGMLYLGILPNRPLETSSRAAASLKSPVRAAGKSIRAGSAPGAALPVTAGQPTPAR
jgi:NADH-quinone oxidoreductase subunit N